MPLRALITGDEGFLGRHFSRALADRGYELYVYDTKRGPEDDCRNLFALRDGDYRGIFDLVIHCAAVIGGREVIDHEPLETAVNLELDSAMFRWAAHTRPKHVVYVSSSAVYPTWKQQDAYFLSEDEGGPGARGEPDQTYGWTKLVGEHLANQLRLIGVPVTVVRPFSGYGVDQDETYPFRAFLERARRRDDPFEIWGDGDQVRDFVHVDDVVNATLTAVASGVPGPLNICHEPMSFRYLAELFWDAAGYEPRTCRRRDQPTGVRFRAADASRISKIYTPQVRIRDVIRDALR